ncbi:adaptin N terminal region-domain-containing protein [Halteromyces radiatus]|uniref:adaptin N terminal region-domain-containing protein n=1 Tax=Halteromyces radiatus TaxID=101107 RepID=UPI00221E8FD8|nr:adaptin N terminal region-domain-containing protein [Halteromyces radiatus]KAI8089672.1 adaptin N terminal region-domain-containing protein [Halteromyces radiatus]
MTEFCYTLVHQDDTIEQPSLQDFQRAFEKGSDETRVETMKQLLVIMLNGDPMEKLLLHVIRFVLPSKNKQLKKLLHIYWEICPKTKPDGKLKEEFILVCNALRNDLQHPNEYIRGATLRFLCKIKEADVLEPLVPSVRSCLEHRHSYVRKNAVFAIGSIYRHFDFLFPDAPEVIQQFLVSEADSTCRRNAFVVLCSIAQPLAVDFLMQSFTLVPSYDELLQLSVIELIRKDSKTNLANKGAYIRCVSELLEAASHSVKYEAANILMFLTSNPTAVKAAASCYIELVVKESDNNVKLIVLDRLRDLHLKHEHVLDSLVMDLLQVLSSPDIDVRRKALNIAMDMVSSRNVQEVILVLKKELIKTHDQEYEKNTEYRQLLIQSIHACAIQFSEVAANVVHVLMEFLGDVNNPSAVDVVAFVRQVVEKFPGLRASILEKLMETFADMKSSKVFRGALWILGEYCQNEKEINEAWEQIRLTLGEIPLLASEQRLLDETEQDENPAGDQNKEETGKSVPSARRILPDGTYATESAYTEPASVQSRLESVKSASKPPLRALILNGDYYLGSVLATTLTKLVLRYSKLVADASLANARKAEAMLIMTSIIRVGQSQFVSFPIDEDSYDRIMQDLRVVGNHSQDGIVDKVYLEETKAVYAKQIQDEERRAAEAKASDQTGVKIQVDDAIVFRQLSKKTGGNTTDEYDQDLSRATGVLDNKDDLMSKLSRIVQLTGFSDQVYAEAVVNVHQYDVLLDVLIVNQTAETLQNLTVEFATLGDLKLVDRPTSHSLAPHAFLTIKASIKVSSTETGVIFGNIVYDTNAAASDSNCVVLNDVHIDIVDYINPATCTETQFRSHWVEFEWENKVNVNTTITDLRTYLDHLTSSTNLRCLTPERQLEGDCGFLSANLYARSIFGEDALANISIEKTSDGSITGHIRIRSKTQGLALSLGDKITLAQKAVA